MRMSLKYRPICRVRYVSYWMPSGCHISAILWERGLGCPCLVPHSPPCSYPKHTVCCDLRVLFTNDSEKMKHSWICFPGSLFHGWTAMRVRVNVIWYGLVLQCAKCTADNQEPFQRPDHDVAHLLILLLASISKVPLHTFSKKNL